MPFTLAHPAAAIPFRRGLGRFGVLSALVIGSLLPDLAYFLPAGVGRAQSHSLAGLVWFCLPLGVLAYGLHHLLVRPVAYFLLPSPVRRRLDVSLARPSLPPTLFVAVVVSLLVGALTHLAWDSFTHSSGGAVRLMPVLRTPLVAWGGYTLFLQGVLQHGSSLLGIAMLGGWAWRWFRTTPEHGSTPGWQPPRGLRRTTLATLLLLPAACGLLSGAPHLTSEAPLGSLQQFLGHGVPAGGSALLATLLTVALVWRALQARAELADRAHPERAQRDVRGT